ncbi:hypothetical protein ACO2Q0_02520 [Phenylobacterium sp. VNQ135]|uniref:hypothetical protein n=1 Tax=Phenylobacterium sp. VNQ135 TaxID=3400922 RepID=UPI003BFF53EB
MPHAAWLALAGLFVTTLLQTAAFAFFMGRLFQKVEVLEKGAAGEAGVTEKVIRLEVEMKHANDQLASMNRHIEGVNRQLANLATNKAFRPLLTDQGT